MNDRSPRGLAAGLAADADSLTAPDKLDKARKLVAELRGIDAELVDLEENRSRLAKRRLELTTKELVDIFDEAGVTLLGVDASGNLPAVTAKLKPFYKANIAAEWTDEKRAEGFKVLEDAGAGDLIRHTFTLDFPKGTKKAVLRNFRKVVARLEKHNVITVESLAVPWNTLTAWVKERFAAGQPPPLAPLGATVGRIVEVEETKTKKGR